jgi:phenylacetate-CoA ligase
MKIENISKLRRGSEVRSKLIDELEKLLRLSADGLRRHNASLLNDALMYAWINSPFYVERFKQGKLPQRIGHNREWHTGPWEEVPFTTKDDLRDCYPFGMLAVPRSKLFRYGESTGSTGSPTSAFMTEKDWERGSLLVELSFMNHFSDEDMAFIAIPYELSFAAQDLDRAFGNLGVTVVPVGTLNSVCPWNRTLEMMRILRPTTLVCTPSRALRLYDMFVDAGHDPLEVGLKRLLYVGETCSPAKLGKIARLWDISLATAYGATETNSLGLFCHHNNLHLLEDRFYFEVIDPITARAVRDGERGELVLTTLCYEAMPLIRYRTGDVVSIGSEPCACGLPFRTVQHYGRYGESLSVRDKVIVKLDLEETVLSVEGTGCYFVAGVESGHLLIMVEVNADDPFEVREEIRMTLLQKYGIEAQVLGLDKQVIGEAMDQMLKPGGLSFEQIQSVARR